MILAYSKGTFPAYVTDDESANDLKVPFLVVTAMGVTRLQPTVGGGGREGALIWPTGVSHQADGGVPPPADGGTPSG